MRPLIAACDYSNQYHSFTYANATCSSLYRTMCRRALYTVLYRTCAVVHCMPYCIEHVPSCTVCRTVRCLVRRIAVSCRTADCEICLWWSACAEDEDGVVPCGKTVRAPARAYCTDWRCCACCLWGCGKIRFCLLRCQYTGRCRDERPGLDSRVGSGAERLSGTETRMRGVRLTASILRRRRVGVNGPKIDLGRIGSRPESRPFHRPASPEIGKERSG